MAMKEINSSRLFFQQPMGSDILFNLRLVIALALKISRDQETITLRSKTPITIPSNPSKCSIQFRRDTKIAKIRSKNACEKYFVNIKIRSTCRIYQELKMEKLIICFLISQRIS